MPPIDGQLSDGYGGRESASFFDDLQEIPFFWSPHGRESEIVDDERDRLEHVSSCAGTRVGIEGFDTHCGMEGACRLHFPFFTFEISIAAIAHSPKSWDILPSLVRINELETLGYGLDL